MWCSCMQYVAIGTLVMTTVAHSADYTVVAIATGVGSDGAGSDDETIVPNGSKDRARPPPLSRVIDGRTKRRHRLMGLLVAVLVCALLYYEVHIVALELWRVIRRASQSSDLSSASGIARLAREVKDVAQGQVGAVTTLLVVLYLILQTLCIPGTIALNAVIGSLHGVLVGFALCVALGTVGASCCYTLSAHLGSHVAVAVDQRLARGQGIPKLRAQVAKFRSELLVYLIFLRLTPVLPNWLINIASPVVNVPLRPFVIATLLGICPQTYLSVRFGTIAKAGSVSAVVTWYDSAAIAAVGIAFLAASRLSKRYRTAVAPLPE